MSAGFARAGKPNAVQVRGSGTSATSPRVAETLTDVVMNVPVLDVNRPSRIEARAVGYTGGMCASCGSTRMRVSGHCEVCEECGSTTGCS